MWPSTDHSWGNLALNWKKDCPPLLKSMSDTRKGRRTYNDWTWNLPAAQMLSWSVDTKSMSWNGPVSSIWGKQPPKIMHQRVYICKQKGCSPIASCHSEVLHSSAASAIISLLRMANYSCLSLPIHAVHWTAGSDRAWWNEGVGERSIPHWCLSVIGLRSQGCLGLPNRTAAATTCCCTGHRFHIAPGLWNEVEREKMMTEVPQGVGLLQPIFPISIIYFEYVYIVLYCKINS